MAASAKEVKIDCRSDTVTKPGIGMRKVIAEAEVGDDVFGDDPTVNKFQNKIAELLDKEAALLVPTGTMGNLVCIMVHCWGRGLEILVGDKSHIHVYEQGGVSQFGGVHSKTLKNLQDGTFDLKELRSSIRPTTDVHQPHTALVCIENTHNKCGGLALPMKWLEEVGQVCKGFGIPLHCDGSRIFNAAVSAGFDVQKLVKNVDSVNVCLSKGLGCPVGSVIAGKKEFIQRALMVRKALGGGMRQAGILAAAGLYALEHSVPRIAVDHGWAQKIAKAVNDNGKGKFRVDNIEAMTNLVFIKTSPDISDANRLGQRLMKVTEKEYNILGEKIYVEALAMTETQLRIACHLDLSDELIDKVAKKLIYILQEFLL